MQLGTVKALQTDQNVKTNKVDKVMNNPRSKSLVQKRWTKVRFTLMENMISKSHLKSKILSDGILNALDTDQGWEVDLRSVPIVIDQYDESFNKTLTVKSVLKAFKTSGKQAAASFSGEPIDSLSAPTTSRDLYEAEALRRQEERLRAYCSVYDIESNSMVHYLKHDKKSYVQRHSKYFK